MEPQTIIIADSCDIIRIGLKTILEKETDFSVIQITNNASELISIYSENPDSICIAGSSIQDMHVQELLTELQKINPNPKLVVLSHSTGSKYLDIALKAGVNGYITRQTSSTELVKVVFDVSLGKNSFCNSVTNHIIGKYKKAVKTKGTNKYNITKREKEILGYIVKGLTSHEIAEKLFISSRTVETHRSNILSKLKLKNTAALVRFAIQDDNLLKST